MKLAKYCCCRCFHEFQGPPGPTVCVNCGFVYVKWINYDSEFSPSVKQPTASEGSLQADRTALPGTLREDGEQAHEHPEVQGKS